MAVAAIAAAAAGAAAKGTSGIIRARAVERAAKRRARALMLRSVDSDVAAYEARVAGAIAAGLKANEIAPIRDAQRTALAANGIDVDSGSGAALQTQARVMMTLDAMSIRFNAERHAKSLDRESQLTRQEAYDTVKYGKKQAKAIRIASSVEAMTSATVDIGLATAQSQTRGSTEKVDTPTYSSRERQNYTQSLIFKADAHAAASAVRGPGPWSSSLIR